MTSPGALVRKLLERDNDPDAWLAANLIEKYRRRLEIDSHGIIEDGEIVTVYTDEDFPYDAIDCRDVTISLIEMKD